MKIYVLLMFIMLQISSFASSSTTCSSQMKPFLHDLQLQCPKTIMYSWPIEVNEESLDKVLRSSHMNSYVAILFYASWCPFSKNVQPKFDALTSMFPQIKHVMVEQSSVSPIVFSRHGIHGVPSILIVNRTTRMRRHGPKDLHTLLHFYQKATGLEPITDLTADDQIIFPNNNQTKSKNIFTKEPYLIFSLFFIFLKALLYLYPNTVSNLISLWLTHIPRLNLSIFGESKQLLTRVLHLIGFKNVFSKLKFSRSARAWTSSLASFSLSKTSSSRKS